MAAGQSAAREAQIARLRIAEYRRLLAREAERLRCFTAAARSERTVAARLEPMSAWGWTLLPDRRWPGTRRANVDLLHVGPGGVLVIDVKAWAEPQIVGGRLFNGDADQTDDIDKLERVTAIAETVLADLGLAPLEVHPVLVFAGRRGMQATIDRVTILGELDLAPWATRLGHRLTDDQIALVAGTLAREFPPYESPETIEAHVAPAQPVIPREVEQPQPDALFDLADLEQAIIEAAAAEPIESWMAFLHPDQARFVRRSWNGPARVRGPAGTGKTVVGLHRAAYLAATRTGRILVTSYVRTLPPVLGGLFARLAPDAMDRVEFCGLHAWARRFLVDRGARLTIDPRQLDTAFALAWLRSGKNSVLSRLDLPVSYWRDEIDAVIKGRGLTEFEQYAELARPGRKTRLTTAQRAAVWDVYQEYDEQLRTRGVDDFNDLLIKALAETQRQPVDPPYAAVIVDEVQDLTCLGLQLVHALVGDRPDGLMLIGDGQQAVYPGGFTLREAGVAVTGRSTVLRVNYRNAAEILEFARNVVSRDEFDDLGDQPETGMRDVVAARPGGRTIVMRADDIVSHDIAMLKQLRQIVDNGHARIGDIAVLTPSNELANRYVRVLRERGVPAIALADYTGTSVNSVKVGTYQRAKGLEFAYVFLPQLDDDSGDTDENAELARRRLFVAMTRARDGLWLGHATGNSASAEVTARR